MENSKNSSLSKLIPVMLCFFAMGFVDLVGIASNYVKADLGLSDSQANIFPSLVFFWFLIFSVPTGMLMSRIGQKKTVLLSLIVTFASLLLPIFGDSYMLMLISFSLLGIGNALMQTSLNPLLSNIVLNELDWWITSQWVDMPTRHEYSGRIHTTGTKDQSKKYRELRKTKLKECYIVRYADDFQNLLQKAQ